MDEFLNFEKTDSCYLDGRYFNKVFQNYPGLLKNPLNVIIRNGKKYISMEQSNVNTEFPGLLKLVIRTPKSVHSNLLILDYANRKIYRFEPLGKRGPYFSEINELVEEYLNIFFDFKLEIIDIELDEVLNEVNPKCDRSGFCTAYIILYAYAYLHGKDFKPFEIRRFAKKVETIYGPLPKEGAEIEYGLLTGPNTNQGQNILIGGLGGALVGGVVAGGGGALAGGLGGALIGSII